MLSHVQHFFKTDYTKYSVEPKIYEINKAIIALGVELGIALAW